MADFLGRHGWTVIVEGSYSEYGERGSIDILAVLPDARVGVVIEVKTDLTSVEATIRKHGQKARLAPSIVARRWGWRRRRRDPDLRGVAGPSASAGRLPACLDTRMAVRR